MWDGVGMRRRKKSDEMKSPGPTLIGDRSEGEKDEEVHSELTSRGPTGLGEVEEKVHVGWSRDEKMKEKKSDELTSPGPTLTGVARPGPTGFGEMVSATHIQEGWREGE